MATAALSDVFQPSRTSAPRTVREREILRVAATVDREGGDRSATKARKEVLKWVRKRVGAPLPKIAWEYEEFEKHMGGRDCKAVRIADGSADLWAIRANDPDKTVAGRVWTTEIFIGHENTRHVRFGLRLLVSAPEVDPLTVEPAVPGLMLQLAEKCGLYQGERRLTPEPWIVESDDDTQRLIGALLDPLRREPVFVLSVASGAVDPLAPYMPPEPLARESVGLARTVVLPARFTWSLTERLGKRLSVFGGAVRAYMPGFAEDADPYNHPLFLAERLSNRTGAPQASITLRRRAATISLRRIRLGQDVLSFSSVQTHNIAAKRARLDHENATAEKKLEAAQVEIENLKESLIKSKDEQDWFAEQHDKAVAEKEQLENKLGAAYYRIQQLTEQLATRGDKTDSDIRLPDEWENFSDWCETNLSGRVALSPRARREVRAPLFEDVAMAGQCLLWLANDYRQARLQGGNAGDLRESIEGGLWNDRSGADVFEFDWQGKSFDV